MADHTPGPWEWEYSDEACSRPIALAAATHDVILASDDADGPRAYVGAADARLIAAAPDLLEACQLARAFGSQGETHDGLSVSEFLRSAIAKATGGEG